MEQRTNNHILVEYWTSKMVANTAAKKLKYVYLKSRVSYKEKWGADFDKIKGRESIPCSDNSLNM